MRKFALFILLVLAFTSLAAQKKMHVVKRLKITILSTMLAQQRGIGEWGFSALVEADSTRILFDAGAREKTVLENCRELNIDLSTVTTLVLSHNHADHTVGWLPLRTSMKAIHANALSRTHVSRGLFDTRISSRGEENRSRQNDSLLYTQSGGKITLHDTFTEIAPGIYLTGPVPRPHPEKNYTLGGNVVRKKDESGNIVEDIVAEDMSLVISTEKGLVLLSGCGHSGIINTITHVQNNLKQQPLLAAIGGFHLLENTDEQIHWTADELKKTGLRFFMGAHCTGIEPVYQIREWVGLKRGECIVGSVGALFELDKGFVAGPLTK
jgi:7,8-dihydropterin-6-yl-methyl-4-(beta-D-ribofuranosyl)aminobenzene 5'-phosphate synthase